MKKIEVIKRVVTTKEGKSFDTFKAVTKGGKLIDCHFRKECKMPTESGYIYVEDNKLDLNKSKKYPELWIHEIKKFEANTPSNNSVVDLFDEE